jgi:hypothetical protein
MHGDPRVAGYHASTFVMAGRAEAVASHLLLRPGMSFGRPACERQELAVAAPRQASS